MNTATTKLIATELGIRTAQVTATATLLGEGATVPFIARYRKERTGELDEVAIAAVRDRMGQIAELNSRRETILKSLEERELISDQLRTGINEAQSLSTLEDIYLPYRPKRRTRAMMAREKGLEPLADQLFKQDSSLAPESAEIPRSLKDTRIGDLTALELRWIE